MNGGIDGQVKLSSFMPLNFFFSLSLSWVVTVCGLLTAVRKTCMYACPNWTTSGID